MIKSYVFIYKCCVFLYVLGHSQYGPGTILGMTFRRQKSHSQDYFGNVLGLSGNDLGMSTEDRVLVFGNELGLSGNELGMTLVILGMYFYENFY